MIRFVAGTVVLITCCLYAFYLQAASPEIEKARQYGALGQVTLRVTDSTGKPVEKALMSVAFFPSDSYVDADVRAGQTDTNGCFCIEGKTVGDLTFSITKSNYYTTTGKHWFYRKGENCLLNNRWQPWNPTNTVVLKEHRIFLPMFAKNVDTQMPIQDAPVGFDLEVGDWQSPHGKGEKADILFAYSATIHDFWNYSNQLVVACSNKMNGLYRDSKDMWSDFYSTYEANSNGYQPQFVFSFVTTKEKKLRDQRLEPSEYLIFRIRTVLDDKGNIVSAQYGKIYGPIEYGRVDENHGGVRFTYYLNPTPNDRNLEFDPSRNLFGQTDRQRVYQP